MLKYKKQIIFIIINNKLIYLLLPIILNQLFSHYLLIIKHNFIDFKIYC